MREAEVGVSEAEFAAMGVDGLIAVTREAGLRAVESLACQGTGAVLQVTVERRMDESRLRSLECVEAWERVAEREDGAVYVISFTAPDLPERLEGAAADLVGTCDPDIDEQGASFSIVGSQDAISGQLDGLERAGISPDLRRLTGYDGPEYPLDALTARQREVIETAWAMGYYEVPKAVSADEVADRLELETSTVNEHLQRAERNLLGQFL